MPGTSDVAPSVLVTERSAVGTNVSTSVADCSTGFGSVAAAGGATDAVLVSEPGSVGSNVARHDVGHGSTRWQIDEVGDVAGARGRAGAARGSRAGPRDTEQRGRHHVSDRRVDDIRRTRVRHHDRVRRRSARDLRGQAVRLRHREVGNSDDVGGVDCSVVAGVGSRPTGMVTVAEFDSVPVNAASIVAVTVKVAVPPASRSTVVAMLPVPVGAAHADPPVEVQVHVAPLRADGSTSATGARGDLRRSGVADLDRVGHESCRRRR